MIMASLRRYPGPNHRAMTLIEMLFLVAIIAIGILVMIPVIMYSRDNYRNAQCYSNLQQIAIGTHQYEASMGTFPSGFFWSVIPGKNLEEASLASSHGSLVSILPFVEQSSLYSSLNFGHNIHSEVNMTVCATRISLFQCPADPEITTLSTIPNSALVPSNTSSGSHLIAKSSYASVAGPWVVNAWKLPGLGQGERSSYPESVKNQLGMFNVSSFLKLDDVTDGASSTIMFGEHSQEHVKPDLRNDSFWWVSGNHGDTLISTMFPINSYRYGLNPEIDLISASSSHGRTTNFAFVDGSVRPIRDTIATMSFQFNPEKLFPTGGTHVQSWISHSVQTESTGPDPFWDTTFKLRPGERFGLYQALSTRAGGEQVGGF